MIPLIVLVVSFVVFRLVGVWIPYLSDWQISLRAALGVMFLLTASAHWGRRRPDLDPHGAAPLRRRWNVGDGHGHRGDTDCGWPAGPDRCHAGCCVCGDHAGMHLSCQYKGSAREVNDCWMPSAGVRS